MRRIRTIKPASLSSITIASVIVTPAIRASLTATRVEPSPITSRQIKLDSLP